jgi:hypothetical protein
MLFALLLPVTLHGQGSSSSSFGDRLLAALREGTFGMAARYRFELVQDEASALDAYASTLRTTVGYRTGLFEGFSAYLQFENVSDIGAADQHNNGGSGHLANGVSDRPVVADPAVTDVNQAYVQYARSGVTVTGGRFVVNLDDQRFVGAVGWRQHHQSFDGVRVDGEWGSFGASYIFLDDVHQIAGNRLKLWSNLLNAHYRIPSLGTITGYAYLLDYDEPSALALSTNTFGGQFAGVQDLNEDWKVRYEAEYATQQDAADNPDRVRADYLHFMGGGNYRGYGVRVGWESLSGDATDGRFTTPLATLHAFNGWADKFLSTPTMGLRDLYVRADGPLGPIGAILVYHKFQPATGDGDYGTEVDVQLTYESSWGQLWGLRGAAYNANGFSTDTQKFWAYTQWSF